MVWLHFAQHHLSLADKVQISLSTNIKSSPTQQLLPLVLTARGQHAQTSLLSGWLSQQKKESSHDMARFLIVCPFTMQLSSAPPPSCVRACVRVTDSEFILHIYIPTEWKCMNQKILREQCSLKSFALSPDCWVARAYDLLVRSGKPSVS